MGIPRRALERQLLATAETEDPLLEGELLPGSGGANGDVQDIKVFGVAAKDHVAAVRDQVAYLCHQAFYFILSHWRIIPRTCPEPAFLG